MAEHQGMHELRATIAREIREAVRDREVTGSEALAVLMASLAAVVGSVGDDERRADLTRGVVASFPARVESAHGKYLRIAERC